MLECVIEAGIPLTKIKKTGCVSGYFPVEHQREQEESWMCIA